MELISEYIDSLVIMLAEMSPYLLLGFFFSGLLKAFVPKQIYRKHLAPRTMGSVFKAAALGIPLPLCSCGVIPTSVELRREGASHGACASFLIATPQTGVDSIAATYSLMGLPFAIVRPLAARFTSLFGGWLVNRYSGNDEELSAASSQSDQYAECDDECCHSHSPEPKTLWGKFVSSMHYAFVEMLQDVGKWLVIGLLIAALITVAVPNDFLAALHDYKLLNMVIVLCVAIPMYVCATGSIPIAVSLMAKGLTPGAALVLLMAGPAVNSASMLVIGKVFGRRTLWLYILSIVIGAIVFGLAIDYLMPQEWFTVLSSTSEHGSCTHCLGTWDWIFISIFMVLLINAFIQRKIHSHHHHHSHEHKHAHEDEHKTNDIMETKSLIRKEYVVKGMNCNHCKANVEKAIMSVEGVEKVDVDLSSGSTIVFGDAKSEDVMKAVEEIGFSIKL